MDLVDLQEVMQSVDLGLTYRKLLIPTILHQPYQRVRMASRYNRSGFMSHTHEHLGGGGPGPVSTVDKFTFSNETLSVTNPMTRSIQEMYSVGNKTQGYFMGSNPQTKHSFKIYILFRYRCNNLIKFT